MMVLKPLNNDPVLIEIDAKSGFCFGVARAVKMAEEQLNKGVSLYSLGDIVHNEEEINRLNIRGMQSITETGQIYSEKQTILFRAHGEPPETYNEINKKGVCLVDATCPVVLKLQQRIKTAWIDAQKIKGQIVIYGKKGHAEVQGLVGQTNGEAIVVQGFDDIPMVATDKQTVLFSQTTMSYDGFEEMVNKLKSHLDSPDLLKVNRTICAQVGNRVPHLQKFSAKHDAIVFVGGKKSSNGKFLFDTCKSINSNSYYVSDSTDIQVEWFIPKPKSIGVCGATSTPQWLMEEVGKTLKRLLV